MTKNHNSLESGHSDLTRGDILQLEHGYVQTMHQPHWVFQSAAVLPERRATITDNGIRSHRSNQLSRLRLPLLCSLPALIFSAFSSTNTS